MEATANIGQIINLISKLDFDDKINIVESVVSMLKKRESNTSPKLCELRGLGAEIWTDMDIEKYIQNERQWE
jgi:hypothetical protein